MKPPSSMTRWSFLVFFLSLSFVAAMIYINANAYQLACLRYNCTYILCDTCANGTALSIWTIDYEDIDGTIHASCNHSLDYVPRNGSRCFYSASVSCPIDLRCDFWRHSRGLRIFDGIACSVFGVGLCVYLACLWRSIRQRSEQDDDDDWRETHFLLTSN